jgi:methanogenic corrinoid protein MtbC1
MTTLMPTSTFGSRGDSAGDPSDCVGGLLRAIEESVIPQMVQAHREDVRPGGARRRRRNGVSAKQVAEFANLVVTAPLDTARGCLNRVRRDADLNVEQVFLDVLTPAARLLGEWWSLDRCSFSEVTLGLVALHQMLHDLSAEFYSDAQVDPRGLHALLAPAPGEQHTFGLLMVAEFFRRAGWRVWSGPVASQSDLTGMVRREWFSLVGLSVSAESRLDVVAKGIREIRQASRNKALKVMVGGRVFIDSPELAREVGADLTATDGKQAVARAESDLQ